MGCDHAIPQRSGVSRRGRPLITEVSPRDGLQNDATILAPTIRAELCCRLAEAGLQRIEAVSFVSPRRVPAMAGAEEVVRALPESVGDATISALVLNRRGFERAMAAKLRHVNLTIAATESFSLRNQGCSRAAADAFMSDVITSARVHGAGVTVTLAVAFGCPFEGRVSPSEVLSLVERIASLAPDEVVLADTIGVAVPTTVSHLISKASSFGIPVGGHFHDTRATGIANCLSALESGASLLDASAGGLGGCPFAPGASGNVATDDLVYVLSESGIDVGIDLDALIQTSRWLGKQLDHVVPGAVTRAGGYPVGLGPVGDTQSKLRLSS